MIEFLSIVMLIFGILQIILFFKIWGMTNDVNEINKRLTFPFRKSASYPISEERSMFLFLLYNKSKSEAKEYLIKVLWSSQYMNAMINTNKQSSFEWNYNQLKKEYVDWFEKIDEEFPTFENIKSDLNLEQ